MRTHHTRFAGSGPVSHRSTCLFTRLSSHVLASQGLTQRLAQRTHSLTRLEKDLSGGSGRWFAASPNEDTSNAKANERTAEGPARSGESNETNTRPSRGCSTRAPWPRLGALCYSAVS